MKIVFVDLEPQRSALDPLGQALYDAAAALMRADDNIVKAAKPISRIHRRIRGEFAPCLDFFMCSVVELVRSARASAARPPQFITFAKLN